MNYVKRLSPLCLVLVAGWACWYFFFTDPAIVNDLRTIPEVGRVDFAGPKKPKLTVLHVRDLRWVPGESLDGQAYPNLLRRVDVVQHEQILIIRRLIFRHDIQAVYCDGLTKETMASLKPRIDTLRELDGLSTLRKLDAAEVAHLRELVRSIGVPGRLLLGKELEILPLEDDDGIQDGKHDQAARQQAMVNNLPKSGLAVVILGGSHDLGPHLPQGTLYVRVTPKSYPE